MVKSKFGVKLNNSLSGKRTFPCNTGVRQGNNLSHLLFALVIFVNDLGSFLSKGFIGVSSLTYLVHRHLQDEDTVAYLKLYLLLYADDTISLAKSADELQAASYGLQHYCTISNFTVNVDKTKILIFSESKPKKNFVSLCS